LNRTKNIGQVEGHPEGTLALHDQTRGEDDCYGEDGHLVEGSDQKPGVEDDCYGEDGHLAEGTSTDQTHSVEDDCYGEDGHLEEGASDQNPGVEDDSYGEDRQLEEGTSDQTDGVEDDCYGEDRQLEEGTSDQTHGVEDDCYGGNGLGEGTSDQTHGVEDDSYMYYGEDRLEEGASDQMQVEDDCYDGKGHWQLVEGTSDQTRVEDDCYDGEGQLVEGTSDQTQVEDDCYDGEGQLVEYASDQTRDAEDDSYYSYIYYGDPSDQMQVIEVCNSRAEEVVEPEHKDEAGTHGDCFLECFGEVHDAISFDCGVGLAGSTHVIGSIAHYDELELCAEKQTAQPDDAVEALQGLVCINNHIKLSTATTTTTINATTIIGPFEGPCEPV